VLQIVLSNLHYVLAVNVTATYFLKVFSDEQISNTFHFTFTVSSDSLKNGLKIRNVVPSPEEEARRILERMDAEGLFN
jgi:hypothetical protein